MISVDTSVVVPHLVGSPPSEARRATTLLEGSEPVALPVTVLVETAHVLRTQYGIGRGDVVEALLALVTRENVDVIGLDTDETIEALVAARSQPGRPIPDALILHQARAARALPLYTFDTGMGRYGIPVAAP